MKCTRYRIAPTAPAAVTATALMLASAVIRVLYFVFRDSAVPLPIGGLPVHLLLPLLAAAWFVFAVLCHGSRAETVCPAVTLGVVFFSVKAFSFASPLHTALCLLLYLTVLALCHLTLCGILRTKALLYPLFGLPLLYHLFVEDMQHYILAKPQPPFVEWLPEISVLCIMAALLSFSFALEERAAPRRMCTVTQA